MGIIRRLFSDDRSAEREQPAGADPELPDEQGAESRTDRLPEDVVRDFLRGQNLEQIGRTDEAIDHYERAVESGFDSAGPYDRLIAIYRARQAHTEVVRVAGAALSWVRTYDDRRDWYRRMKEGAQEAIETQPDPSGPEF